MSNPTNKLSDATLKKLLGKPSEADSFLSDGEGLQIKRSKSGVLTWYLKYRTGGRGEQQQRLKLGNYPDLSLRAAREKRAQCRAWLAEGKNPRHQLNELLQETLKPVLVKDALNYWLKEYVTENRKDASKLEKQLYKHIVRYIGDIPLAQCDTRYWLECFDRAKKETPVAAGHVFQACKQALKFCRKRRYAFSNVLDDLSVPDVGKKAEKGDRFHTQQELADILHALDANMFMPYYAALVRLLIVFGGRTVEVRLSEIKEWNLDEWLWVVPKEHSKNGIVIFRPIPEGIRHFIKQLIKQNKHTGLLLGEIKEDTTVSQWGRSVHKRLKQEHWSLHDFRRTFTTMLNDMGIPPHIVDHITGHTLPGMGPRYNHARYLPDKLDALNKWMDRLDLLMNGSDNVVLMKVSK